MSGIVGAKPDVWINGGVDNDLQGYKIITKENVIKTYDYDEQRYVATVYDYQDLIYILDAIYFYENNNYGFKGGQK